MKRIVTVEIDDDEIVEEINNLGVREAMSLILKMVGAVRPNSFGPLCLAVVDSEGEVLLVADGGSDWDDDASLCQHGECCDCKVKVISWAKDAECPICGRGLYLT